jgi:predicted metalloprotease
MGRRESANVDDRRRLGGGGVALGGGGALVVVVIALLLGVDPRALLQQSGGPSRTPTAQEDELKRFVAVVLADTEDVWHEQFRKAGKGYREPRLVLFSGRVQSACGMAGSAVGPFYCPADEHVYIDLQFFAELKDRFGAPGDFAQAYVVAHEVGHHVQKILGYSDKVHAQRNRLSEKEYNRLSVRLELQADYLAGVWAHHAQKAKRILEPGDLEEALRAANAIGDDRLQKRSQGTVVPDSFTHGTSAQRMKWFRLGLETGDFARREELFTLPYERL